MAMDDILSACAHSSDGAAPPVVWDDHTCWTEIEVSFAVQGGEADLIWTARAVANGWTGADGELGDPRVYILIDEELFED